LPDPDTERPADPSPKRPPTTKPRRTKRFVLPDEQHDERMSERIEAFVQGPTRKPHRAQAAAGTDASNGADPALVRPRTPRPLDTRQDWNVALRRESARHARYGRPASVLLIELAVEPGDGDLELVARSVVDVMAAQARETDRAVRIGATRFAVLMPETGGRAARAAADRLDRTFQQGRSARAQGPTLHVEIATAPRAGSLEDAVDEAETRLVGRNGHS
jgi:hypothetical protein